MEPMHSSSSLRVAAGVPHHSIASPERSHLTVPPSAFRRMGREIPAMAHLIFQISGRVSAQSLPRAISCTSNIATEHLSRVEAACCPFEQLMALCNWGQSAWYRVANPFPSAFQDAASWRPSSQSCSPTTPPSGSAAQPTCCLAAAQRAAWRHSSTPSAFTTASLRRARP